MKKYGYEFSEEQLTQTAQVEDRLDILTHVKDKKAAQKEKKEEENKQSFDFTDPASAD